MMNDQAHGLTAYGLKRTAKLCDMNLEKNDMYLIYFFAFFIGAGLGYYLEKIFI